MKGETMTPEEFADSGGNKGAKIEVATYLTSIFLFPRLITVNFFRKTTKASPAKLNPLKGKSRAQNKNGIFQN